MNRTLRTNVADLIDQIEEFSRCPMVNILTKLLARRRCEFSPGANTIRNQDVTEDEIRGASED